MATRTVTSSTQQMFDPPGNLNDFNPSQRQQWSDFISQSMDDAIVGYPKDFEFDGPRSQFYNPLKTATATDLQFQKVSWIGFPKKVKLDYPIDSKRWEVAESDRNNQDEYCEWSTEKSNGKVTRVTFTCEGPEYWDFMAQTDPDRVVALYQQFINPNVKPEDLFDSSKKYKPDNKWNNSTTNGAMHLIQINNTLGAEIELAAGSSVVRKINGRLLTEQQELIKCGKYGDKDRNSDPFIGAQVNQLTRDAKAFVSLANPVGLYFDDLITAGWETPDKSDPASYWKIVRGTKDTPVRAVYEVPKEKSFTVGDIKINGIPIQYGAQIADFVQIKLVAQAQNLGTSTVEPLTGCRRRISHPNPSMLQPSILSVLATTFDKYAKVRFQVQ